MGTRLPKKGKRRDAPVHRSSLADALFSTTQQRVIGLLYANPERSFSLSEIINVARLGHGTIQREVRRLAEAGILATNEKDRTYRANAEASIFAELRALVSKLFGVAPALREALERFRDRMDLAILFGSEARGAASATSDIDVLIVSDDLTLEEVFAAVTPIEGRFARRVNPTLYTSRELALRRREKNPFVMKVFAGPHEILMERRGNRAAR